MDNITIYTDGACKGNPGPGGWGAVLVYKEHVRDISGYVADTTNNRMELLAPIKALSCLKTTKTPIHIHTDSTYVQKGITLWVHEWENRGWKTSAKKPVKNKDLWIELLRWTRVFSVRWYWVKGHAGHPLNERADMLARKAIDTHS